MRRAPQHRHLPQAVLSMDKAQGVEHIRLVAAKDMRHIGIVAHDLDRGGNAIQREGLGIVGQGPRQDVIGHPARNERQDHKAGKQAQRPTKGNQHHRYPWGAVRGAVLDGIRRMQS